MKIALTADIHFHKWTQFSKNNSRLYIIKDVFQQIIDYCTNNDIFIITILGDLFHKRGIIDVEVYNVVYKLFDEWQRRDSNNELWILAGNHDQAVLSGELTATKPLESETIFIIENPITYWSFSSSKILWIPYIHEHDKIEQLITKHSNDGNNFIFGHFGLKNAQMINTDFRIKEGVDPNKLPTTTFLGHYHTPQTIGNATYIGSPLHHTFHDEGQQKSFIVLDTTYSDYSVTRIPTKYPEFKTLNITKDVDLSNYIQDTYNYYKINMINITDKDLIQSLVELYPNNQIMFQIETQKSTQQAKVFKMDDLIKQYIDDTFSELKEQTLDKVLQLVNKQ